MRLLNGLQPENVFYYFEQISSIPRGSGNTRAIANWLVNFAIKHNLKYYSDQNDNVIIYKNASKGYENHSSVILQGHTDMVCEKTQESDFDFQNDGIKLILNGDTISAQDTTLGADNGIAVAMMLAILADTNIRHPRIEAVFTSDEEIGMLGAASLDFSVLTSKYMINIDSEDEGVYTVGCAGGNVTECILPILRKPYNGKKIKINIFGLKSGHSGVDIDKGRANANVLMAKLLSNLVKKYDIRIVYINGGKKDNVITAHSEAVISVPSENIICEDIKQIFKSLAEKYTITEPDIEIKIIPVTDEVLPMDKASTLSTVCLMSSSPNGIQAMSSDISGLVQTSLNMGVVKTHNDSFNISFCVRSSVNRDKQMLVNQLDKLTISLGGKTKVYGDYPAWEFKKESPLRNLMTRLYKEMNGSEPSCTVIHAGLECGLFASSIDGLDCISIGPDMSDIHTVREKLYVSSVCRTYNLLIQVLSEIK